MVVVEWYEVLWEDSVRGKWSVASGLGAVSLASEAWAADTRALNRVKLSEQSLDTEDFYNCPAQGSR